MNLQLFAHRQPMKIRVGLLQRGHIRRWWCRRIVQQSIPNPHGSSHRMRIGSRGIAQQHTAVTEEAAAMAIGRQRNSTERETKYALDSIVPRERLVQHGEIRGKKLDGTRVLPQQLRKHGVCLAAQNTFQPVIEAGKAIPADGHIVDETQLQPLIGELSHESLCSRFRQAFVPLHLPGLAVASRRLEFLDPLVVRP